MKRHSTGQQGRQSQDRRVDDHSRHEPVPVPDEPCYCHPATPRHEGHRRDITPPDGVGQIDQADFTATDNIRMKLLRNY
jgi:hypothetical protein